MTVHILKLISDFLKNKISDSVTNIDYMSTANYSQIIVTYKIEGDLFTESYELLEIIAFAYSKLLQNATLHKPTDV